MSGRARRSSPRGFVALAIALSALAGSPLPAEAQSRGQGYLFGGPGAAHCCGDSTGLLHVGAGAEGLIAGGIGLGAELGFLAPWESIPDGLGVFSANGAYHWGPRAGASTLRPFVTGGYSLFFREGHLNLGNFGGGLDYWMRSRLGLRLEFRDHVHHSHGTTLHYWAVRVGVVFR